MAPCCTGAPPSTIDCSEWPAEAEDKLLDRSRRRKPRPLDDFQPAMDERNARLRAAKQPELIREELLGGRLYTG